MEVHLSGRGIVCRDKKAHRYQLIISDIYVLIFVSQTYKNDTKEIIKFLIQIQELHNC